MLFISVNAFANSEVVIPELTGRVNFIGEVQPTKEQKKYLASNLKSLEENSKIQMAVLVVDSIKPLSIEEYSIKVVEKWKLGLKDVDNGVLLLVATKDRKARMEVGRGLEGILTDLMAKRIQKEKMIPHFKKGDFVAGVLGAVEGVKTATVKEVPIITQAIEQKKEAQAEANSDAGVVFIVVLCVVGGGFLFMMLFMFRNNEKEQIARTRREDALEEYRKRTASYSNSAQSKPHSSSTRSASSTTTRSTSSYGDYGSSSSSRRKDDDDSDDLAVAAAIFSSISSSSNNSSSGSSSWGDDEDDNRTSGGGGSFSGGGASVDWDDD